MKNRVKPRKKEAERRSVSFPKWMLEQAERQAAAENRSFSGYIQNVIAENWSRTKAA